MERKERFIYKERETREKEIERVKKKFKGKGEGKRCPEELCTRLRHSCLLTEEK